MLSSHLPQDSRFAIIGASGAIGQAFLHGLREEFPNGELVALSKTLLSHRTLSPDNTAGCPSTSNLKRVSRKLLWKLQMVQAYMASSSQVGSFMTASHFQPEKSIKQLTIEKLQKSFLINAIGPALIGKHFLPCMPKRERSYFAALSARVGSISDNRVGGWHGYRASKAALNMFLKNLSIEGKRSHP